MSDDSACLDPHELWAFARGAQPLDRSEAVLRHLERCPPCAELFRSYSRDSDATTAVKRPGKRPSTLPSEESAEPSGYPFLLPPVQPDEIGRLGTFRVLRLLGRGGMGLVFLAEDIALRRPVALKVMNAVAADAAGAERFLLEARAMAAIKHRHLITVYQVSEDNGAVYLAMELLQGETLEAHMRRVGRLDVGEVVRLAREIAAALDAMHARHLVHRDVKPSNIWLEAPDGLVKLLDFGLVRCVADDMRLTRTGMVVGTPAYMSPEQARGEEVDARSDLFSLGCVLYMLCTGQEPFQGSTVMAQLTALATRQPAAARELNPDVPGHLSGLVADLLAKEPGRRPQSAADVIRRLSDQPDSPALPIPPEHRPTPAHLFRDQTPVPGPIPSDTLLRRDSRRARTTKTRRRKSRTWIIVLCGITGLSFLLAGFLLARQFRPEPERPPAPQNGAKPDGAKPEVVTVFLIDLEPVAKENWPHRPPPDAPPPPPPRHDDPPPRDGPPRGGDMFRDIRIKGGERSPHGIGMHPGREGLASLTYDLDGRYDEFQATVGLNFTSRDGAKQPLRFRVYGDGQKLWESRPIRSPDDVDDCRVSVKGVKRLRLETFVGDHEPRGAHAVWVEPRVTKGRP